MKKILGILRGFPGLGRVVSGVSILETLRDSYDYDVKIISYLQGNKYLNSRGYNNLNEVTPMDYCSIGLLPTNKMGVYIHNCIREFTPDLIVVDGEPLMIKSIKISHPSIKVVALLNPADVVNPNNNKEAMDFFNEFYSLSDLAIVHGIRRIDKDSRYNKFLSINTIIRSEIIGVENVPTNNIYCVLGGGTVNVGQLFVDSTITIGQLCQKVASLLPQYTMHIVCSSQNIFNVLNRNSSSENVVLHDEIIPAEQYYCNAGLVITRSGRNTLSELAYLGIPAISFVSGCSYRKIEQTNNINDLNISTIVAANNDISPVAFADLCQKMMQVKKGELMATLTGDIRVLLSGERVALNYLQRMSGIATYTRQVAKLLEGSKVTLLDTRKTTPNCRVFEKYAVRVGGGCNHRYNLSDGVLLKDNHIGAAGSITKAITMAKEYAPFVRKIEIEVETLEQVKEAVEAGADIIMLDNMTPEVMKQAVELIDGRAQTECSGNITKENIAP